jgi:hypothetical protein
VACSGDDATSSEAADAPKAVAPSKVASKAFSSVSGVTAPCSDVVPNSPEQKEQQKKEKLAKLSLSEVIQGEPKGGWGRTMLGLERYRGRLRKHPAENAAIISEVSLYLD